MKSKNIQKQKQQFAENNGEKFNRLRTIIRSKFKKKRGTRKTLIYNKKEKAYFLLIEKGDITVYAITETKKGFWFYLFLESKNTGFTPDLEFNDQGPKGKLNDLLRWCDSPWRKCKKVYIA